MQKEELYTHVAHSQVEEQRERRRTFDSRMGRLFTVSVALMGVAAIAVKDFASTPPSNPYMTIGLAAVIGGVFLWTLICSLNVFSATKWTRGPKLRDFHSHLDEGHSDEVLTKWVGDQYATVVEENERVLAAKARWLNLAIVSIGFLAVLVLFLTAAIRFG